GSKFPRTAPPSSMRFTRLSPALPTWWSRRRQRAPAAGKPRPCRLLTEMRKVTSLTSLLGGASLVGVATLVLAGGPASAQSPCDFLTGGGYIIRPSRPQWHFGAPGECQGRTA